MHIEFNLQASLCNMILWISSFYIQIALKRSSVNLRFIFKANERHHQRTKRDGNETIVQKHFLHHHSLNHLARNISQYDIVDSLICLQITLKRSSANLSFIFNAKERHCRKSEERWWWNNWIGSFLPSSLSESSRRHLLQYNIVDIRR